ncbi:MAG: nucleoside 2-deoxyribosyltransferase [Candidatus Pacearchaeota archaeon]
MKNKNLKIYFAASIRGGRGDSDLYKELIDYLKGFGEVLSEHIGDKSLTQKGSKGSERGIHDEDLKWLFMSDVVVAEVTNPSLGVGYEIRAALEKGKKILTLYRLSEGKKLSAMIKGSPEVDNFNYKDVEEAKSIIRNYFENELHN